MKKILLSFMFLGLLTASCGNKKDAQQKNKTPQESIKTITPEEINIIDSVTIQIQASKDEIEAASQKLDELLNELQ